MTSASLYGRAEGFASGSSRPTYASRMRRVIQYRRILKLLVVRDLKVRYADSALGYVWTVLDPLAMSFVYWFIFTKLFSRGAPGEDPYILFLVSGQLLWSWFNGGLTAVTRALRSESQMVRSSNVPRELWVLRVVCSKGVEYLFSLPVLALFALAYLKVPNWHIVLLPLAWVLVFVLLSGLGMILAPLTVLVNDVDRIVPIVLRLMFYMSPVLYNIATVVKKAPEIAFVYKINPMVGPLSLARSAFFPHELHWNYIWESGVMCVVIFVVGLFTFTRLERPMLKEV